MSLLLASTAFVYAQDEHKPKPQEPQQEEARPEAAKPAHEAKPPHEENAKPPKQEEAKPPKQDETKPREDMKPKQQEDMRPRAQDDAKAPKQNERVEQQNRNQHQAAQRGSRIPDDKFRSHFGHEHTFKVQRTTVVEGRPRFDYGGYSFELVDAWPGDWAYSDECYVDYIDGEYFLFDLLHPGVRIAIVVM
jgi:hypothetical protein